MWLATSQSSGLRKSSRHGLDNNNADEWVLVGVKMERRDCVDYDQEEMRLPAGWHTIETDWRCRRLIPLDINTKARDTPSLFFSSSFVQTATGA
jgi:hypothetical protein